MLPFNLSIFAVCVPVSLFFGYNFRIFFWFGLVGFFLLHTTLLGSLWNGVKYKIPQKMCQIHLGYDFRQFSQAQNSSEGEYYLLCMALTVHSLARSLACSLLVIILCANGFLLMRADSKRESFQFKFAYRTLLINAYDIENICWAMQNFWVLFLFLNILSEWKFEFASKQKCCCLFSHMVTRTWFKRMI